MLHSMYIYSGRSALAKILYQSSGLRCLSSKYSTIWLEDKSRAIQEAVKARQGFKSIHSNASLEQQKNALSKHIRNDNYEKGN